MHTKNHIHYFFVCVSFLLNSIHLSHGKDAFLLGCGLVDAGTDKFGRRWFGDGQYIEEKNSITKRAECQDPSLEWQIPYTKSRIFTYKGTYNIPVKFDKTYLVRFHFYPVLYGKFNPIFSYFSVTVNDFVLLKNFSASITCQALSQMYLIKEYSLAALNKDTLSIVFKPSKSSFAFVNGIEVIEIPKLFDSAKIVGSLQEADVKSFHSETMYRLNVGGNEISPEFDSGLTRTWHDDTPFLVGSSWGRTDSAEKGISIQYQGVPEYAAPVDVYKTRRSMGMTPGVTLAFNLSWAFRVDPNSSYLVRFHLCEYHYSKPNQLVFSIFVNNQTIEDTADVIVWTGGINRATFKDYVVYFSDASGDQNLWVALHPSARSMPEFMDAYLNGIEIFKISDTTGSLAGLNPPLSAKTLDDEDVVQTSLVKSNKNNVKLICGVGATIALLIVTTLFVVVYRRKKKFYRTESCSREPEQKSLQDDRIDISAASQGLCRHFSLADIIKATKNFDHSYVIGFGGFGNVYEGLIDGGTKVAVKRAKPSSHQGFKEFQTEVEILSTLRHRHLVSLIGFCHEGNELCLVYEYMPRGTLKDHLYNTKQPLTWKQRLEICLGASKGLHYLHTGSKQFIVHRDVKTSNILLDDNWRSKVSDFGICRKIPDSTSHVNTQVKGTMGYMDPSYCMRQQLTRKSDVYSFGVVLFETLCARPAIIRGVPEEQVSLAHWVLKCKNLDDMIDSDIKGKIHPECFTKFVATAKQCLAKDAEERPSMGEVMRNLEIALELQKNVTSN